MLDFRLRAARKWRAKSAVGVSPHQVSRTAGLRRPKQTAAFGLCIAIFASSACSQSDRSDGEQSTKSLERLSPPVGSGVVAPENTSQPVVLNTKNIDSAIVGSIVVASGPHYYSREIFASDGTYVNCGHNGPAYGSYHIDGSKVCITVGGASQCRVIYRNSNDRLLQRIEVGSDAKPMGYQYIEVYRYPHPLSCAVR